MFARQFGHMIRAGALPDRSPFKRPFARATADLFGPLTTDKAFVWLDKPGTNGASARRVSVGRTVAVRGTTSGRVAVKPLRGRVTSAWSRTPGPAAGPRVGACLLTHAHTHTHLVLIPLTQHGCWCSRTWTHALAAWVDVLLAARASAGSVGVVSGAMARRLAAAAITVLSTARWRRPTTSAACNGFGVPQEVSIGHDRTSALYVLSDGVVVRGLL
jgi:hypothetical protein